MKGSGPYWDVESEAQRVVRGVGVTVMPTDHLPTGEHHDLPHRGGAGDDRRPSAGGRAAPPRARAPAQEPRRAHRPTCTPGPDECGRPDRLSASPRMGRYRSTGDGPSAFCGGSFRRTGLTDHTQTAPPGAGPPPRGSRLLRGQRLPGPQSVGMNGLLDPEAEVTNAGRYAQWNRSEDRRFRVRTAEASIGDRVRPSSSASPIVTVVGSAREAGG